MDPFDFSASPSLRREPAVSISIAPEELFAQSFVPLSPGTAALRMFKIRREVSAACRTRWKLYNRKVSFLQEDDDVIFVTCMHSDEVRAVRVRVSSI